MDSSNITFSSNCTTCFHIETQTLNQPPVSIIAETEAATDLKTSVTVSMTVTISPTKINVVSCFYSNIK